jgi:large subunit ribosomal protein L3
MAGLIGRKIGMTRIFDDDGVAVPVTVVEAGPCPVVGIRRNEADGDGSMQLGFGRKKPGRSTKAELGHAARAGLEYAPKVLREFPLPQEGELEPGTELTVEVFSAGDRVSVVGTSKGRGFQGAVKRHGFAGRPATHGHPMSRNPGSLGPGTDPSRVIKGKRLPGQMGSVRRTVRNLQIVRVDPERNLLFVRGAVPGARNGYLFISK